MTIGIAAALSGLTQFFFEARGKKESNLDKRISELVSSLKESTSLINNIEAVMSQR